MKAEEMSRFKERLEALRLKLTTEEESLRDSARPVQLDQASVGRLSRMDAMQGQAMAMETLRRQREQLHLVDEALARIDRGEYGVCRSCEEDINPRRLEFNPAARLCFACAGGRRRA